MSYKIIDFNDLVGNIEIDERPNQPDYDTYNLDMQDKIWHIKHLESKYKRYNSNTAKREQLADWAITVVSIWLFLTLLTLVLNDGRISDTVMVTLLGTTTLNVIGIIYIVLKGYFDAEKDN